MNVDNFCYWIALAHLPKWRTERINRLIVDIIHQRNLTLTEFFDLTPADWQHEFQLTPAERDDLKKMKVELPNFSFLAEEMLQQGFDIIPFNTDTYSQTLKNHLKLKQAPPLLYTKGNAQLLNEPSTAIVGSRNASTIALQFTDHIARKCVENHRLVVSGYAKGVDQKALDSTLKYHGRSIIVLPQGILTFGSQIKKFYQQIIEGNILILSTFFPKASWQAGLAMARNVYIYGLSDEIYVAESNTKGGTWSGVIDGLRKGRRIFVRQAEAGEENANHLLIQKGAVAVDMTGEMIDEAGETITDQMDLFQ